MSSTANIIPSDPEKQVSYAMTALGLMKKYNITPIPENYTIWFYYAAGSNKELMREVDNIINNKMVFTSETCLYLYNKYIMGNRHSVVNNAANNAQKVLLQVLKAINEFSDETQSYNKNVDQYIDHISQDFGDSSVKDVVRELLSKTVTLKESGQKINQKLEESTKEIYTLKKDLHQVTMQAQFDSLTGVYNRKAFEERIDEQILAAQENKSDLCLMMIDIDYFKRFNDRFGHLLGDEVLKTVARALTDILKGRDVVGRFGGEEFVVSLPETSIEGAMKAAEIVRTTIASKELKRKDTGQTFGSITVSVGVACFRESDTLPTLIKRADDALYRSKRNGRNCVTSESD